MVKFPAALYHGDEGREYLAVYSHHPDIAIAEPPSLKGRLRRVAHVAYSKKGIPRKSISIFHLDEKIKPKDVPELRITKQLSGSSLRDSGFRGGMAFDVTDIDKVCGVEHDVVHGTPYEVLNIARADVAIFVGDNLPKSPPEPRVTYHRLIVPETRIKIIEPERILTPGKPEFTPSCRLEANIDFSKGCISGWQKGEKGRFDGKTFTDFSLAPWGECRYCYAIPKHKSFPITIYNIDQKRLRDELLGEARLTTGSDEPLGRPVSVLRFGKRTEAASDYTLDQLVMTLETCLETGTRTVLPTKFLRFNRDIAELLRRTHSTLLYSIGFDEYEQGAVSHGCNNDFRLEQAINYRKADVNSNIYLLVKAHAPRTQRENHVLRIAKRYHLPIQLLPMRFPTKAVAIDILGVAWPRLKGIMSHELFQDEHTPYEDTYELSGSMELVPLKINEDWLKLVGENSGLVRMCHHNSQTTWCGNCFLKDNGFIIPTQKRTFKKSVKSIRKKKKSKVSRTTNSLF